MQPSPSIKALVALALTALMPVRLPVSRSRVSPELATSFQLDFPLSSASGALASTYNFSSDYTKVKQNAVTVT